MGAYQAGSLNMNAPEAPSTSALRTVNVDGVPFIASTVPTLAQYILTQARSGNGGWVVTPNIDILRRWRKEQSFRTLVHQASIFTADGRPIVWASQLQGTPLPARLTGADLFVELFQDAMRASLRVALIGGNEGAAKLAAQLLQTRAGVNNPDLVGCLCPPFGFERQPEELAKIHALLRANEPHLVFVGLGSPKQEQLIARLRSHYPNAWYLGVGVSFSFVAGDVKRAPVWMQKRGLEWMYRLFQEPNRLAHRYLVNGFPFALGLLWRAWRRRMMGGAV